MKIILRRGGNEGDRRFEASDDPQEVPDRFGKAMIARGLAEEIKAPRKKAAPRAAATPEDTDGSHI